MRNTLKHLTLLTRMKDDGLLPTLTGSFSEDAIAQACGQVETLQLQERLHIRKTKRIQEELVRVPDFAALYEINEIVVAYESRLSTVRQTEETNRQLMTSLSHDVRTPLTTLLGYLDATHKGLVTGKDRDDYIETARRKAHDLKEYIDVLFDWFKLNSNEFALEIQSVEVAELTRNILIDWIPIFEDKQVDYDIDIPEQPVRVRLDMDSYMRIINNLIQNVIAHSHADKIKISLSKKENSMELLLADNGVGIEKEDLKHIFERLYKCDKGRSEKGSGLGLSIVHQLVEKMGGSITVESVPGKGTEFTLLFPLEI